ncbi:TetR family transcriptional regulator [Paenibacillus sp. NPDC057934]|uniref:TetR family transcriptional regulator n=1 Tax=Paenibacillus sp. NPDC057934 TaxID=3346282 RepID=UPI0036DB5805
MVEETLSRDLILDAAEAVLRKFGLAKANMSDIARALGVSHAALYRHYDSKASLRKAVVERWMQGVFEPLKDAVAKEILPEQRLYRWLETLRDFKRDHAQRDPELFAMYARLVVETPGALEVHNERLIEQLTSIIEDGRLSGAFVCKDDRQAAVGVFIATTRFHHASHASEWGTPDSDAQFEAVWQLILNGLVSNS